MRTITKLLILLLLPIYVTAQNIPVKVTKSEVFKERNYETKILLVESDGKDGLLIIRSFTKLDLMAGTKDGYYFEHYDSAMNLINEYEYTLDANQSVKFSSVLGMITHNDQLHIVDFKYSKTDKSYICSAWTSKINDFKFTTKELFRVKSAELKQGSNYSYGGFFLGVNRKSQVKMIVNENKNAFVVSVNLDEAESKTQQLFLFDNALNKKIEHVYKRDFKDVKYRAQDIEVSKDGNVIYLLGKVLYDKNKKTNQDERTEFELARITNIDEKTVVLGTNEFSFLSLRIVLLDDKLVCVGFYSESENVGFKGLAYLELNSADLNTIKKKLNPFSEQFIIDKFGKNKEKNIRNIEFKKIFVTSNQDIIINAEETRISTMTRSSGSTSTIYYNDDIITAKLDKNGEMIWARNINKKQSTGGDPSYLSYTSILKDNEMYFFVNSSDKIKTIGKNRLEFKLDSANNASLNIIKTDKNGNISYQEILNDKDIEVPIMVKNGQILDDSIYFMGRKGSKKQLIKVEL